MAGAGYKLFNTGDVLTAAQVNTYLQEQAVMRFANATARTTALSGVLAEGMMSYLDDTNSVEVYNGSAWVSVGSTGDITGVTAGTGISGGGTSGDVTITNSMATAIDAKGDLIVGTGADTFARLAVGGTSGHALLVDSSTATGLKWGAVGKVLQVVSAFHNTSTTNSTNTYADTGLTATITPSATTSKIAVFVAQNGCNKSNGNTLNQVQLRLLRGGVEIAMAYVGYTETLLQTNSSVSLLKLDDPNTTSAVTYKTQFNNPNNTASVTVQNGSSGSTIILMEIGA